MEHYTSPHLCFGQRAFLVCLFLMMHTRLDAAYWGFMVCLVEVICHIKTRWQAAHLSVEHAGNLGNCSPRLVIVCLMSFFFGCLACTDRCFCPSSEFRRFTLCRSGFTSTITDPEIGLQAHVPVLILAWWSWFASSSSSSNYPAATALPPFLSAVFNAVLGCS